MFKLSDIVDGVLMVAGFTYSLENIEHALGIIILIIQIAWLVSKLVYKFIRIVKEKRDPAELGPDISSAVGTLEDIKDKIEEVKKNADESDKQE